MTPIEIVAYEIEIYLRAAAKCQDTNSSKILAAQAEALERVLRLLQERATPVA